MPKHKSSRVDARIIDSKGRQFRTQFDAIEGKSLMYGIEKNTNFRVSNTQYGKIVCEIFGEAEGISTNKSGKYKEHEYENDLRTSDERYKDGGWEALILNKKNGKTYFMSAKAGEREIWASLDNIYVDNMRDFENYEIVFKYTYVCKNPTGSIEYDVDMKMEGCRVKFSQMLESSDKFANRINWEVSNYLRKYEIEFLRLMQKNYLGVTKYPFGEFMFRNGGLSPQVLNLTQRILQFGKLSNDIYSLRARHRNIANDGIDRESEMRAYSEGMIRTQTNISNEIRAQDNNEAVFVGETEFSEGFRFANNADFSCSKIKSIEDMDDEPFDGGERGGPDAGVRIMKPKRQKTVKQQTRVKQTFRKETKKQTATMTRAIRQKTADRKTNASGTQRIEGIIFDLDGVLSDSEAAHRKSFNEVFAKYGVKPVGREYWLNNYTGTGSHNVVENIISKNQLSVKPKTILERRQEVFSNLIRSGQVKPVRGSKKLVKLVTKQGIKIIVASGGHRKHVKMQLDSLGLEKIEFLGEEDVMRSKPAPDVFLKAAKRIGLPPRACLVIEDAASGLRAAKRAGMKVILIGKHHPKSIRHQADLWAERIDAKKITRFIFGLTRRV